MATYKSKRPYTYGTGRVIGGGYSGQAGAMRHGIARALLKQALITVRL
jgi:ribosomal protein S9